ncbi:MAG: COX15/CtaA family protein [Cytophagaceae bacterium]
MTLQRFYSLVLASLISVYLVILAGSIVRATGSGMGCPDWPKCFGQYIPPTDISQLPENYEEKYAVKGHSAEFNAAKTWTEYGNRLVGAIAGIIVAIQFAYSLSLWKYNKSYTLLSLSLVLLMGFQAVLGAGVVWTFLKSYMITLHMLAALVIVILLIYLLAHVKNALQPVQSYKGSTFTFIFYGLLVLTLIQIFLGTEVREEIDALSYQMNYMHRETWIELTGTIFKIHRSFSILVVIVAVYLWFKQTNNFSLSQLYWYRIHLILLTIVVLAGVLMAYFAIPAWAQPVHFFTSTILLGVQWFFVFRFMVGQKNSSL